MIWRKSSINPKNKVSSPELGIKLKIKDNKWKSMLIEELENYKPLPSDHLENKIDFYFSPYNISEFQF